MTNPTDVALVKRDPSEDDDVAKGPPEGLAISSIIRYLKTVNKMKEEDVSTAIREAVGMSDDIEGILYPERQMARAVKEATRSGKREGKREGVLALVKRQLAQRFGALPAHAVSRIDAAKLKELEAMSLRLLDAKTIDEVLDTRFPVTR